VAIPFEAERKAESDTEVSEMNLSLAAPSLNVYVLGEHVSAVDDVGNA
jgi:hypothetical protein